MAVECSSIPAIDITDSCRQPARAVSATSAEARRVRSGVLLGTSLCSEIAAGLRDVDQRYDRLGRLPGQADASGLTAGSPFVAEHGGRVAEVYRQLRSPLVVTDISGTSAARFRACARSAPIDSASTVGRNRWRRAESYCSGGRLRNS